MTEKLCLLAKEFDPTKHDPTGWLMSEKLDGYRALWDGEQFVSRNGKSFTVPDWFAASMPEVPLDGELYAGRKNFQDMGVVRSSKVDDPRWKRIQYFAFDAPEADGTFAERYDFLRTLPTNKQFQYLTHWTCNGYSDLMAHLRAFEEAGAEGLMLRDPMSRYERKRSGTLLKVKTFHDAEAKVVNHVPGKGKHLGRMGALDCQLHDGTTFQVGTGFSDAQRHNPPPIGATITFSYQELSRDGVPRFPVFLRVYDAV